MRLPDIIQAGPPTTIVVATIYGMTLQDWASALAIVLLLLQIAYWIWDKAVKPWRKAKRLARIVRRKRRTRKVVEKVVAIREENREQSDS